MQGPQVTGLNTVEEIINEVKNFARKNPNLEWIVGGAYEAALIPNGDFKREWLDEAVLDRPVLLRAMDFHTIWVNSKALEIANLNKNTSDPKGGQIARDKSGHPTGTLREPSAINLIEKFVPRRTLQDDLTSLALAYEKYKSHNVVAMQDAWVDPELVFVYEAALKNEVIQIPTNLALLATPQNWQSLLAQSLELKKRLTGKNLTCHSIKFLTDGALSAGTAFLLEPYLNNPKSLGLKIWDDAELNQATKEFDKLGFQLHIHAIGDGAIRQSLDAIENVISENGHRDRRAVIAHAQLISQQDLPRFAKLEVIANMQPLWCYLDVMNEKLILPAIGEERNNRQYQLRSLLDSGARIAFGSDWPVTSEDPNLALNVPVTRQPPKNPNAPAWNSEQSITLEESINSYTKESLFQLFLI